MTEHDANPQAAMLEPQGPSVKAIAKGVLAGINPIPHGEAISSLEYLAQIRGTIFTTTEAVTMGASAWGTANVAIHMPFIVRHSFPIKQLRLVNGAAVSGNLDLGVYDSDAEGLARTLLVSTGSTAQSGTTDVQLVNVSTNILSAGLYYMASVLDNGTGEVFGPSLRLQTNLSSADSINTMDGVFQEASAFPLPATATPVLLTADPTRVPIMYVGRHAF